MQLHALSTKRLVTSYDAVHVIESRTRGQWLVNNNLVPEPTTMDISEVQVNPSPDAVIASTEGVALNNEALKLSDQGDLEGAERLHLRAIELKERGLGQNSITLALSRNALGELYMRMNKYAEAEVLLKAAIDVRERSGPPLDAAVSRDNLAALYETQGKMAEAREMRMRGAPDSISCSNYKVRPFNQPDRQCLRINSVPGICLLRKIC